MTNVPVNKLTSGKQIRSWHFDSVNLNHSIDSNSRSNSEAVTLKIKIIIGQKITSGLALPA